MKNKSGTIQFLLFCMFVLLPLQSTYGQLTDKRALREISPLYRETVSMASSLSFKDALDEFNDIAKRKLGKVIVDPYDIAGTIELNVDNMNWLDALESVLRNKGFEFEEYSDHFLIKKTGRPEAK